MKRLQRLSSLALALLLVLGLSVPARAHEAPDLTRKGAISVTFDLPAGLKSYGSLTLYRVGDIQEDDGNYSFAPVPALAGGKFSFADVNSASLAKDLADYIAAHPMPGTTRIIQRSNGVTSANFTQLTLGLYLAVQHNAATGYEKLAPFLISIPYVEDGTYRYELTAQAKSELKKEPKPEPPPKPKPPGPTLPQTGQLNWPVPVLAVLGMTLFAGGWFLRNRNKKEDEANDG